MSIEHKVFSGKRYAFLYYRHTKQEAQKEAERERRQGWNIRVVKQKIGVKTYYDLYGRRSER